MYFNLKMYQNHLKNDRHITCRFIGKLLGSTVQYDLKWTSNTRSMVIKANKRLWILRCLTLETRFGFGWTRPSLLVGRWAIRFELGPNNIVWYTTSNLRQQYLGRPWQKLNTTNKLKPNIIFF